MSINQSINHAFWHGQVIKSSQDPLEVGNNLPGINDNVTERGLENVWENVASMEADVCLNAV